MLKSFKRIIHATVHSHYNGSLLLEMICEAVLICRRTLTSRNPSEILSREPVYLQKSIILPVRLYISIYHYVRKSSWFAGSVQSWKLHYCLYQFGFLSFLDDKFDKCPSLPSSQVWRYETVKTRIIKLQQPVAPVEGLTVKSTAKFAEALCHRSVV